MNSPLLSLFQELGVVSNGHFVLSSGQHSDEYWEKFRLLEWPRVTEKLCHDIAERYQSRSISAVIGPTTGGALLAQEVARQLGSRCLVLAPQHLNAGGAARAAVVAAVARRLVDAVGERLYPFFEPYQSDGQSSESPPTVTRLLLDRAVPRSVEWSGRSDPRPVP